MMATAERVWSVRCVAYALTEAKCVLPEGDYTLPQYLDHISRRFSLAWTQTGEGVVVFAAEERRARTQEAMPSRSKWKARERFALSAVRLIDSLSEGQKERIREGHRVGTWRLSEESLGWLSVLVIQERAPYENPSPLLARAFMGRHAHTELAVQFRPEVLVYSGEQAIGTYESAHRLVPLPAWGQAIQPRYQPAPEDLPEETEG